MAEAAARALEEIAAVGRALDQQATRMDAVGADARTAFEATAATIASRVDVAASSLDQAVQRVAQAGDALGRQASTLEDAAERSERRMTGIGARLAEQASLLESASSRGEAVVQLALATLRERGAALTAAADAARRAADDLAASEHDRRRGSFLRSSRFVVDGLNSLAIDLSRSFSPTLPERLMAAFVAGDRGVFVRRLLKLDPGGGGQMLRAKYQEDAEFRRHVDEYIRQFEALRAEAMKADPDAILTAAFLTSDIGKLYMFLAEAIDRPEGAGQPAS
jgi:hypothetical protein